MFEVEDDGKGFDVATQKRGSGNQNMADRVEALDGTLTIASSVGAGTTVTGTIPVRAAVMVGPMS
jgi:signal transduction histidine kinase